MYRAYVRCDRSCTHSRASGLRFGVESCAVKGLVPSWCESTMPPKDFRIAVLRKSTIPEEQLGKHQEV